MFVKTLILSLLLVISCQTFGQTASVAGRIMQRRGPSPLAGVHIKLTSLSDTKESHIVATDEFGKFVFSELKLQSYMLEATYVGYSKLRKTVIIDRRSVNLGDLIMSDTLIPIGEVVVQGEAVPAIQKGDTTVFNAKAFRTHPDASAEDLVAKMPGITVDNSGVKAHGEDVQQVLVDGKPFFGNDPTIALRNLPADVVDKIQVFDKMSDQAEFTGFDDGQSQKTLNLILRPEKRNGEFGKSYGGYGDDKRYLAGGNINLFHNDVRFSTIGLSNNINQQNFSVQDLLGTTESPNQRGGFFGGGGFGGRRGGGGGGGGRGPSPGGSNNINNFLVGQQNGITSTNSLGLNYSDKWGSKISLNQSYFFNATDNQNAQVLNRQYSASQDSVRYYDEHSNAEGKNYNHRFDSRFEYAADSSNSIILLPRLYFQNNNSSSFLSGENSSSSAQPVNQAQNNARSNSSGNDLSGHAVYRHRFGSPGRTISLDLGIGSNGKQGTGALQSLAEFYNGGTSSGDTLHQQSTISTNGFSLSPRLVYTEPLGNRTLLQITYNPSFSKNTSDSKKYALDSMTGTYSDLETALSNTFENTYSTHNAGIGYRYRTQGFNLMADISYQAASLKSEQTFPFSHTIDRTFYNLLPSATLNYTLSDQSSLRMFYRTSTKAPGISQLQNAIDNSNPLLLTTGNPDLKQSYTNTLVTRYSLTNSDRRQSLFCFFTVVYTKDYIGNSTMTAVRDTTLSKGIVLNKGTQLSLPVNLDGYWNVRSFFTYGIPVEFLSSNVNLNSGYTFSRTPGIVNQVLNFSNTSVISGGVVISSNINEDVDFTLAYTGNYSVSRNSLESSLNNNYYYHTSGVKLNLIFLDGIVFRNELNNVLYSGLSNGLDQNLLLWNVSLGKKILSNQRADLKLSVTDVLNQNKSVNRTVTEIYVEDTQTQVLGRYVMFICTYTLR